MLFNLDMKGQGLINDFDDVYGMNPVLYNGRIYVDYYDASVKGNQFLDSPKYKSGSIQINHQVFENQYLNYDIFKQKLLLSFKNYNQTLRILDVPIQNIQSFSLLGQDFIIYTMPDSALKIFQIIGKDALPIYLHWEKEMKTTTSTSVYDYRFTEARRQIWIVKSNQIQMLSNNKSLLKLYSNEQAIEIKKWLKDQRIKINRASNHQLQLLAEYLYTL